MRVFDDAGSDKKPECEDKNSRGVIIAELRGGECETKHSPIIVLVRFMNHKDLTCVIHEKYSWCKIGGHKGI